MEPLSVDAVRLARLAYRRFGMGAEDPRTRPAALFRMGPSFHDPGRERGGVGPRVLGPGDDPGRGPRPVFQPGEIVHLNDVEELPDSIADRFPASEAGDLLLSFRNLHMVMVVEPEAWAVKWYRMGPWIRQHDPDFEPDGTITIFDNRTDDTIDGSHLGGSRILRLDPVDGSIDVLYGARPGEEMYTNILGKQQRLPNGNLLITESQAGRLLEVDQGTCGTSPPS